MVPDIVPAAKEYGLKSEKLGVQGAVGQRQGIMSGCTLSNGLPRWHLLILGMICVYGLLSLEIQGGVTLLPTLVTQSPPLLEVKSIQYGSQGLCH